MREKVCAIFVSYNPERSLVENVAAVMPQADEVIVIDDGSDKGEEVLRLVEEKGVTVLRQGKNLGLACALNRGIKYAIEKGHRWIATFDQDSLAPTGMIGEMLAAYGSCGTKDRVGIISPFHYDPSREKVSWMKKAYQNLPFVPALAVITSGCLVKAEVFAAAGFFKEELFIDYIDFEFCLRAGRKGYMVIQAPKAVLTHRFGEISRRSFMGMDFFPTNHSLTRKYYNARNRFIVYENYFSAYPSWVVKDLYKFTKMLIKTALFEKNRLGNFKAVARGVFHAFSGVTGKFNGNI